MTTRRTRRVVHDDPPLDFCDVARIQWEAYVESRVDHQYAPRVTPTRKRVRRSEAPIQRPGGRAPAVPANPRPLKRRETATEEKRQRIPPPPTTKRQEEEFEREREERDENPEQQARAAIREAQAALREAEDALDQI